MIPVHEVSHISKVRLSDEQSAILQTPPIIMENKHSSIMFKKEIEKDLQLRALEGKATLGAYVIYGCPNLMPHLGNQIPWGKPVGGQG